MKEHHTCDICDEPHPSAAQLRLHQKNAHNRTFEHQCVVCSEPFDDERKLLDHQDQHHQVKVAEETVCPEEEKNICPELEPKLEVESCPASPETGPVDEVLETVIGDSELTMETDYAEAEERTNLPTEVAAWRKLRFPNWV